jgi:hypothetical protein
MSTINVGYIEGPSTASNKIYIKSGSVLDITNSPDGAASIDLAVDAADITSGTLSDGRFASDSILFVKTAEISYDNSITADGGTTFTDATGFTITIASADVARCSKLIIVFVSGFRVNQATYTFGETRIQRSAPGTAVDGDRMGFGTANANDTPEIYACVTNIFIDDSLGSGDHTYKLQFRAFGGTDIYAGTMYPRNSAGRIVVSGVK